MATLNLGRLKPVFRSTWNSATAYNVDDIVVRNNQSYISIQAGTNQDPATATAYWTLMAAKGSDGTDVGATLANKEIAFKTNAGAVDGIPIGNAGEFLKVNSGATGYEFGAVSSDYVKIKSVNITSSTATLDFVHGSNGVVLDGTYKYYKVLVSSVQPATQGQNLRLRVGSGGSFATSGYLTESKRSYYSGGEDRGSATDHLVGIRGGIEDSSNGNANVEYTLNNMYDSDRKTTGIAIGCHIDGDDSNPNQVNQGTGGGVYNSNSSQDSIRLYFSSGNITNMSATLYGIKA